MRPVLLISFLIITIVSEAQTPLTPGKGSFEKKWVKNTSYTMTWYAIKDTTKLEIGNVSTQIATDNNTITVVTRVNLKNMKEPWVDSTIADNTTLKPIRHASYNGQRDMVLNFGGVVSGFYNDKIKNTYTVISDTTLAGYFDSNLYPVLIGWLPLREGYSREISIYNYNPGSKTGIIKATVNEVKSGIYESLRSGSRNVWVIKVTDEIGNSANTISTYYFDRKDRKLWKQEISIGDRKMILQLSE